MAKVSTVSQFFNNLRDWNSELETLRSILCGLDVKEELKWGMPTYSVDGKNIVSFSGFKNHYALWFHQGALLKDESKVLRNAQKEKTVAMMQWRFERDSLIDEDLVRLYVLEAIDNQLKGLKVEKPKNVVFEIAPELKNIIESDKNFATNYNALTKGRQKEYSNYIADAKQLTTKERRLNKIIPLINKGIGLNDKYKNC